MLKVVISERCYGRQAETPSRLRMANTKFQSTPPVRSQLTRTRSGVAVETSSQHDHQLRSGTNRLRDSIMSSNEYRQKTCPCIRTMSSFALAKFRSLSRCV